MPLTSLRMVLLLLREQAENLTAQQVEILAAAIQAGEELAGTIDELLDLTPMEAEQLRLQRERVDLEALTEQAARSLRPRFEDAAVRLHLLHDAPVPIVLGEAGRLGVVFTNLLDNALQFTPSSGEVRVLLASVQTAATDGRQLLQIAVTDTSPGIPPEYRERVFEKFFRVEHHEDSGPKGVRGAGIGLYLCRQFIEAHGGSIRCEAGAAACGTRIAIHLETETNDGTTAQR
jgi:NtrC-family two-component system sensor histidine kinase KinB